MNLGIKPALTAGATALGLAAWQLTRPIVWGRDVAVKAGLGLALIFAVIAWRVRRRAWQGGLHLRLGAWLAAGLIFAMLGGILARRAFESGLLARAQAFALTFDTVTLESWLRDEVRIGNPSHQHRSRPCD